MQSVTPRQGDNDPHLCNIMVITDFLGGSTHTYSSALPVQIEHAFSRVILQRRVKTEIYEWYCCTVRPRLKRLVLT